MEGSNRYTILYKPGGLAWRICAGGMVCKPKGKMVDMCRVVNKPEMLSGMSTRHFMRHFHYVR